jgi:hypothetical protein
MLASLQWRSSGRHPEASLQQSGIVFAISCNAPYVYGTGFEIVHTTNPNITAVLTFLYFEHDLTPRQFEPRARVSYCLPSHSYATMSLACFLRR